MCLDKEVYMSRNKVHITRRATATEIRKRLGISNSNRQIALSAIRKVIGIMCVNEKENN